MLIFHSWDLSAEERCCNHHISLGWAQCQVFARRSKYSSVGSSICLLCSCISEMEHGFCKK